MVTSRMSPPAETDPLSPGGFRGRQGVSLRPVLTPHLDHRSHRRRQRRLACRSPVELPPSFRRRRREMCSGQASWCSVGRETPNTRVAVPFGTQRSTVRSGQRRRRFRRFDHQREWDAPHLRLGKELGPVQGGATALHAAQPLSSAVGSPWPSAFVSEPGRHPPIFYRIFYRMVRHRVFRGGMSQHAVAAKAQVSKPVRPLAISAVTPTKQLITRRVAGSNPAPATNRRCRSGPVPAHRPRRGRGRCRGQEATICPL